MKKLNKLLIKQAFLILATFLLAFCYIRINPNRLRLLNIKIYADDNLCPSNYTLQQCYDYINQQMDNIRKQQNDIKNRLDILNKQQNNIYNKLAVIKNKIQSLQLNIKEIKLSIYITEMQKDAIEKLVQNIQIDISEQNTLLQSAKNKIYKLIQIKYLIASYPWYFYIKDSDFQSVIEYISLINILITRQKSEIKYINYLKDYIHQKEILLKNQREKLKKEQQNLINENTKLAALKKNLEQQQQEQEYLMAQIAQEEAKLQLTIQKLKAKSNYYNEQLRSILNQMGNKLPPNGTFVTKGAIIGRQGHTGCAYGSHLHFALLKWTGKNWTYVNPVSEGILACSGSCQPGNYIISKIGRAPLNSALITQNYWAKHHAFDLVSNTDGNQLGTRYCVKKGEIKCSPNTSGCFGLHGEGAPVFAIYNGTFYGPKVDWWGAKYVFIIHNINNKKYLSLYVHLK